MIYIAYNENSLGLYILVNIGKKIIGNIYAPNVPEVRVKNLLKNFCEEGMLIFFKSVFLKINNYLLCFLVLKNILNRKKN